MEQASRAFDPSASPGVEERTQRTIEDLYAKIGQLTVERVLCPRGPDDEQAGLGSQTRPRPQGFVDTAVMSAVVAVPVGGCIADATA